MSLIKKTVEFIDSKQGEDIKVLKMTKANPLIDYMVICHVSNQRLLSSLANYIEEFFSENKIQIRPIIKKEDTQWILIDANDIIVHLFLEEDRQHFALEKLWKDCLVSIEELE